MRFKKIAWMMVPALLAAALPLAGAPGRAPLSTVAPNLKIMRSAHRGVSAYAPENTLPAIQKAIDMGYDYVEMDIHYTRDGVPVLMHDDWVNRTTNGFGPVVLYSLAGLEKLDAGAYKGAEFKGTRVPTLEQALQLMQGKIKLYLDQKEPARPELIWLLKKYGFYPYNLLVCHGAASIASFLYYEPDAPVMPMLRNAAEVNEILARYPGTVAFDTTCSELTPEMVRTAHQHGIMIFTDALGRVNEDCMARPVLYGADVVQIDDPKMLDKIIREHGPCGDQPAQDN